MSLFSRNNLIRMADHLLLPALILVIEFFSFTTVTLILKLPGTFTANRAVLLVLPFIVALFFCLLFFFVITNQTQVVRWLKPVFNEPRRRKVFEKIIPASWLILITVSFIPPESLGGRAAVYQRLSPIFLLLFVLVSCLWFYWIYYSRRFHIADLLPLHRFSGRAGLGLGLLIALILMIISISGKGIGSGTQYWGKTGVPILNWQVGLSWLIVFVMAYFYKPRSQWFLRNRDLLIFGLLWISAFVAWQSVPVPASRFTTAAYPPNFTNYPYSDAADYAIQAELILSGNGFTEGFVDKPLHLTFLACLNWLANSDFSNMILFQKAILAAIPGLVFLIGLRLYNRPAGLMAGMLVLFIQMNNLATAPNIQSTNVAMTMSEPWTALSLVLCCLAIIYWWENPMGSLWLPALAGGVIGLAVLIRLNVMVSIPIVVFIWLLFSGMKKKRTWISLLIFSLFFTGTLVPWGIRNQIVFDDAFKSYMSKARGVIFKHRIKPVLSELQTVEITSPPITDLAIPPVEGTKTSTETDPLFPSRYATLIDQMTHSGFHNLVTVGMALPVSPFHTNLDQTIRLPYWDQEWDGELVEGGWIILSTSLLMLVIGFSRAWKERHIVSLVPGLILVSYLGANTVSMVSGGRYIVPVDWVLPLYYSFGLWAVTTFVLECSEGEISVLHIDPRREFQRKKWGNPHFFGIILIIGLACLPAALGLMHPIAQNSLTKSEVLTAMKANGLKLPSDMNWDALEEFAKDDKSIIMQVKTMFPRWMKTGEGDTGGAGSAFSPLPFDHLSFVAIDSERNTHNVVLPVNQQISFLPDASEVFVIGCRGETYIDSVLLSIVGQGTFTYSRPEPINLTCPLPLP